MKKYLLFAITLFSLFIVSPKAAVIPANLYDFKFSGVPLPKDLAIAAGGYSQPAISYLLYDIERPQYSYLIFDVCTTGSLDQVSIVNSGLKNYFDENSVITYNTNISNCKAGGYNGVLWKVQVKVGKFEDSSGDGFYASSYLKIINGVNYTAFYNFVSLVVSDEDVLFGLKQNNITNDLQRDILNQQKEFIKKQDQTNSKLDDLNSKQDQTNSKLDNIKDMDAPDSAKTKPDDSDYQDYEKAQGNLTDKISDIPTDTLEIGIDANSSNFIFDTMNKLINAHPAVFSMFIAILSIGIIKLGLGR